MKTLHLYLTRQVLMTLLMTVAVFVFVLLLANVLKEILTLLINGQVTLWLAAKAIGLLIPFVLVFALPMGMLTAALLVFGRFSADHELTATRASGVSLLSLVTPILLLSVALSLVCASINMYVAPQARVAYKSLLFEMGAQSALALLPEKTYVNLFTNHIVYVGRVRETNLEDILIYNLKNDKVESYIQASSGRVTLNKSNQTIRVQLFDSWSIELGQSRMPFYSAELELPTYTNQPSAGRQSVKITDKTFSELSKELRILERRAILPEPIGKISREEMQARLDKLKRQRSDITLPMKLQMHRQVSFSFACIGFTLVGIPLGIRAHRRETTFGIAIALLLVLAYYSFFILGQAMDTRPEWAPHLILWIPNFLFQAVGGVLLWRANRGI